MDEKPEARPASPPVGTTRKHDRTAGAVRLVCKNCCRKITWRPHGSFAPEDGAPSFIEHHGKSLTSRFYAAQDPPVENFLRAAITGSSRLPPGGGFCRELCRPTHSVKIVVRETATVDLSTEVLTIWHQRNPDFHMAFCADEEQLLRMAE